MIILKVYECSGWLDIHSPAFTWILVYTYNLSNPRIHACIYITHVSMFIYINIRSIFRNPRHKNPSTHQHLTQTTIMVNCLYYHLAKINNNKSRKSIYNRGVARYGLWVILIHMDTRIYSRLNTWKYYCLHTWQSVFNCFNWFFTFTCSLV